MAGRQTKLNPDVQERICNALREGNTRRVAAILGGIGERTFYDWLDWADPEHERHNEIYSHFSQAVTRAEAECESEMVAVIKREAANDDKGGRRLDSAIEWLQRRRPKDWSRQDKLDITSGEEPITAVQLVEVRRDDGKNGSD